MNTKIWTTLKTHLKLEILMHNPLFWGISVLKLLLGMFLASNYFSDLFFPFFEKFVNHPLHNPYEISWENGAAHAFPYPAFMLFFMTVPRLLTMPFGANDWYLPFKFLLYHLPIFIADFAILVVFLHWFHRRSRRVILLIWGSPVLFYINYMHGQLDAIPIALLIISLYFLMNGSTITSAVLLGLGIASKTHIVLTLPFFLIYLWKRQDKESPCLKYILTSLTVFLAVNIPFLENKFFYEMVFENIEQNKILQFYLQITQNGPKFYIIPAVYILLIFYSMRVKFQNRDIFLVFIGFLFGVLLLFIAPMPGWYYWVIPFFGYFFCLASIKQCLLFISLQAFYFLYFALSPVSDYSEIFQYVFSHFAKNRNTFHYLSANCLNSEMVLNCSFTLMQTLLIANCLWIYWRGIKGLENKKLASHSVLIGIAGDSGSGKTTLTASLLSLFTPKYMTAICGDDMHKWQRGHAQWKKYTHLNPKGNELHQELRYLTSLRQNIPISRRHYDHSTGTFTKEITISPKPLMAIEGLHAFLLKPARNLLDLKIFMQPDEKLLLHWKIQRDMIKRGYSIEQVIASVEARKADAARYVAVQANAADIIFSFIPLSPIGEKLGDPNYHPPIGLRVRLCSRFCLDPILEEISAISPNDITHYYDCESWQVIEFKNILPPGIIAQLGEQYVPDIQDFGIYTPAWKDGWEGLQQLIATYLIFHDNARYSEI